MAFTQIDWEALILAAELEDVSSDPPAPVGDIGLDTSEGSGNVDEPVDAAPDEVEEGEGADSLDESEQGEDEADEEHTEPEAAEVLPSSPLPVYLVENPEEASGIELYAVSGSVYPGTISSTYLDYFEGIADKLGYGEDYVVFREGQYTYKMFWGEGLEESSGHFTGSGLHYCSIYTGSGSSNMTVSRGTDSLSITAGTGFVYSSLGDFPNITKGGTHIETLAILFALGFSVVYNVCHDIFDYIMEHVYRK